MEALWSMAAMNVYVLYVLVLTRTFVQSATLPAARISAQP